MKSFTDFSSQTLIFVLRIIVGIFVGAYVARYLGASQLGVLALIIAVVAILNPFIDFGTKQILEKKSAQEAEGIAEAFWPTLVIKFLWAIAIVLIFLGIGLSGGFPSLTENGNLPVVLASLALLVSPLAQFNVLVTVNLKNQQLLRGQLFILVVLSLYKIWLIQSGKGLNWFVMAYFLDVLANMLNVFGVCWRSKIVPRIIRVKLRNGFAVVRESWMLMLSGVAVILYMKSDVVMIDYFMTSQDVGYYSVASNLIGMAYFLPVALSNSLKKKVYKRLNEQPSDHASIMQSLFTVFNAVGIAIAIAVIVCGSFFVSLVYGDEYLKSGDLLMALALGIPAVALGVSRSLYLIHEGMTRFVLLSSTGGLVTNVLLNCILIPLYGVIGAVVASVVSYYISAMLSSIFIRDVKIFHYQINATKINFKKIIAAYHEIKG